MYKKSTRRTFIQTAALGVTAVGLGSQQITAKTVSSGKEKIPPPLKLGLMTYNLGKDWDIETIIKNCSEAGWVHAELRTTHKHGVEVSLGRQQRSEVKKRFADSPLEAISLASAFSYHDPDPSELKKNIEGTKEYLQLAADVGAIGIRVFPNAFPDGVSREKTIEQIGRSLAEVGKTGHDLGVDVRVCVHGRGTNRVPVIRQIMDHADSPWVFVNWNCNPTDIEDGGLVENFNLIKKWMKGVHLHDLINENYPYRQFLHLLREFDPSIYCNAEVNLQSCEPVLFMKYYKALFLAFQNVI